MNSFTIVRKKYFTPSGAIKFAVGIVIPDVFPSYFHWNMTEEKSQTLAENLSRVTKGEIVQEVEPASP